MKRSTCLLMLTIVAAVHFVLAATVPPADDELYYWCWSQDLQASYFDHPPMTALLIRASTSLFGHTLFGLRFPACLCALATLFLIGHLTDRRGIGWLLATPMIAFGSILITPDAPVLLIWTAYAIWLIAIQKPERSHRWVWWLAGGVLLGLGGLSKYTMALAVPGALLSFMLNRDPKQAAWRLGFVCHLVVCLMVMSPIFLFNMQHDFRPMQFQLNHAAEKSGPLHPFRIFEFIGGQVLLVGLMPFLLLPWCLRHRRELGADSRLRISLWLFVFPSLFFLMKGATGKVEGNWPFISYMTMLPLALRQWDDLPAAGWQKRWLLPASFAVPILATALIAAQLVLRLPLPGRSDRMLAMANRYEAAKQVADFARMEQIPVIYAANYQITSHLRFQQFEARQMRGLQRDSNFTLRPGPPLEPTVYMLMHIDRIDNLPKLKEDYGPPQLVVSVPERASGKTIGEYALIRYDRVGE